MPLITLALPHNIILQFALDGDTLLGLETVTLNGKPLRSAAECIFPEIATPDGWEVDSYEYVTTRQEGDATVIVTRPRFRLAHRMEWAEHALHLRINPASWRRGPITPADAVFEWIIRPAAETLAGVEYVGFSYGFRYHAPGYAIYQIEDKATWELGGSAVGNTFILRGANHPPVAQLEKDTAIYSGWDLPGIANPHIFQHLPLYAALQGFTFQYDDEHTLITTHERPSHVRSLFQKSAGDDKLLHFNQFCFNLTDDVTTPARKILVGERIGRGKTRKNADESAFFRVLPRPTSETAIINHFIRVREALHARIRAHYGLKDDPARPDAHVETWHIANVANFTPIFQQLHEWGFRRAFLMPLWRSNETDVLPRFAEDRQQFGILGNMCCPLELEIAACYGGWDGLARILAPAVELGIETYMWFGSHFSSLSPLGQPHSGGPDPSYPLGDLFARDVSGQCQRNNYGHVLFAIDQNAPGWADYFIAAYRRAKECGLNGIFRDSHFNMAADTITYKHVADQPVIESMHDTEAAIQHRFQHELEMLYIVESLGVLGTPMCGSDYDQMRGHEWLYANIHTGLDHQKVLAHGDDPAMAYFRALSARISYQLHIEVNQFPAPEAFSPWWDAAVMAPLLQAYHRVEPHLKEMWLLDDDCGILWKDGDIRVIFAYREFDYPLPGVCQVIEVISGNTRQAEGKIALQARQIYIITQFLCYNAVHLTTIGNAHENDHPLRQRHP